MPEKKKVAPKKPVAKKSEAKRELKTSSKISAKGKGPKTNFI